MTSRPVVLITRPEQAARALADEVEALGWRPLTEPMLTIKPLDVALPDLSRYGGLIFTSANGVNTFTRLSSDRTLPVITVGPATAEAARLAGFGDIHKGPGDVKSLNAEIAAQKETPDSLLHLSGEHIAGHVELSGCTVDRLAIYKAEAVKTLSSACLEALDKRLINTALFFSARTAVTFTGILDQYARTAAVSSIKALCLADSVVKSLHVLDWGDVQVARTPDREGMLELLGTP